MKKILGLILVVLAYVGLSYYSGMVGEQYIKDQVELNRIQANNANISLDVANYQRGVFKSSFDFSAQTNAEQFDLESATVDSKAEVFHGPVIFADGLKFGWFYARTENALTTSDSDVNALLATILPQGLGRLSMLGEYGGSYDASWRTDVIAFQDENGQFNVAGLDVHSTGSFDSLDSSSTITTGDISARSSDGMELAVTPIHGELDVEFIAPQVPLSSGRMQVDTITITSAEGQQSVVNNLEFVQRQRVENDKVDTKVRMSVASVAGAMPMSNLYYEVEFNQVSQAAIAAWAELSPKLQTADDFSAYEQELNDALALLLHKDLALRMASGGEAMGGYVNTKLDLNYVPPVGGRTIASLTTADEYLKLIKGSGQVVISKEIMNGTPLMFLLSPYMDTYIVQQGDEYVVNARISDGKLWVGDTPIDLTPIVAAYLAQ
ncbi:DUF945 family protein [Gilvimarinus japonicus]|uniref:DUF945 family protein n=1 Tax=Gilvimarinus japonicus TaxID=1796469 RepID=A0ABV7HU97_9GAMM